MSKKILIVSRCAWTLYVFRKNLILALIEKGAHVAVAASTNDAYVDRVRALGVNVLALPIKSRSINPIREVKLLIAMIRTYRSFGPDIIHHFTIKPVVFGSLAARLSGGAAVINTITGLGYAFTDGGWLIEKCATFLYRIALRSSAHVFFQNHDDHRLFLRKGLVKATTASVVAGSGVDIKRFRANRPAGSGKGPVVFLFIGRVLKDKGIIEFIDAAAEVRASGADAEFRVLGGIDESNPSSIAEHEFRNALDRASIEWRGQVEDVKPEIEEADVVVLPSYREGIPRSLLEGAAMGRAIITTNAVGCRDVVEDGRTGILIPVKSVSCLVEALQRLAHDRDTIAAMGAAGRRKVKKEFNEDDVIEEIIRQYDFVGSTK